MYLLDNWGKLRKAWNVDAAEEGNVLFWDFVALVPWQDVPVGFFMGGKCIMNRFYSILEF